MTTGIHEPTGAPLEGGCPPRPAGELESLVREWQRPIYNLAHRLLRDPADAADATQEVFLTLLRRIDRYDPARGELRPWIYRVATREILAFGRRSRRRLPRESGSLKTETRVEMNRDTSLPLPDEGAARRELRRALQEQIRDLPEEARSLLVLHFYSGLTQGEVAQTLSLPRSTVQLRIRRALDLVGRKLRIAGYPAFLLVDLESAMRSAASLEVPAAVQANLMQIVSGPAAGFTTTAAGSATTLGGLVMANKIVALVAVACAISLGLGFGIGKITNASDPDTDRGGLSDLDASGRAGHADADSLRASYEKALARAERLEAENRRLRRPESGAFAADASREAATSEDTWLEVGTNADADASKASGTSIDWDRFSSLFAGVADELMGVDLPADGSLMANLSPEAQALVMELMSEATRIGIAGQRVSEHPFFDGDLFTGLTDAIFSESLGLTGMQRDALSEIGRSLLAKHLPAGGLEDSLPSERMAARAAIAADYLASMQDMLGPDQARRWDAIDPLGNLMMNGAGRVTDLGIGDANGDTIVDFWQRSYDLPQEVAQSPSMQDLASRYASDARSIMERFGQTGESARELSPSESARMNLELASLQGRMEREYVSLLPADQSDRFFDQDPHLLRFLPTDGERVRVTMGGIF